MPELLETTFSCHQQALEKLLILFQNVIPSGRWDITALQVMAQWKFFPFFWHCYRCCLEPAGSCWARALPCRVCQVSGWQSAASRTAAPPLKPGGCQMGRSNAQPCHTTPSPLPRIMSFSLTALFSIDTGADVLLLKSAPSRINFIHSPIGMTVPSCQSNLVSSTQDP